MRNLLAAFIFAVSLTAIPPQSLADDATYVRDLIKKGYLQQVHTAGSSATVIVGPKFDRLNAVSAKEEVCAAVLRHARAGNRQVAELQLVSASGEPLGRFDGTRLRTD